MKVDGIFIEAEGPGGEKITGLECSECGQEFFDAFSIGDSPRIVESAVAKFIEHADQEHHSDGGVFIGERRPRREWRACA
jgi:hypothetical protein